MASAAWVEALSGPSAQAAAPSLVEGSKSPTAEFYEYLDAPNAALAAAADSEREYAADAEYCAIQAGEEIKPEHIDLAKSGHCLSIECEAWRGIERTREGAPFTPLRPERARYRATAYSETLGKSKPPVNYGDRWTRTLSARGQKAIKDSSEYLGRVGLGYQAFVTLTLTAEQRAELDRWDYELKRGDDERRTLGALAGDWINVLQQRYRNGQTFAGHYRRHGKQRKGGGYRAQGSTWRGYVEAPTKSAPWTPITWQPEFKLPARGRAFQFTWVAEAPTNADGKRNPHIHVLTNWTVKAHQFHAWARWIEAAWGKGFAKIEKIRKPRAAGAYLLKAAGYLTKGGKGEQGEIRGNRYSVGERARAPRARTVGRYWSEVIRDIIGLGHQAGRENWPPGLWFHRHGFGAENRAAWGRLWTALKADGVTLGKIPIGLYAAKLANAAGDLYRRLYDDEQQWAASLAADDWTLEPATIQ